MKLAKGVVFFLLMIVLGSCFDPPEFPIEPQISFKDITFKKGGIEGDSLLITITFKDGDGDLGINESNPNFSNYPFHPIDYFLEKNGALTKIATEKIYDDIPPLIKIDAGQSGKLVTVRTRNNPEYSGLPSYNPSPFPCASYYYDFDSIYVSANDKSIFDASYNIIDTISNNIDPSIYLILDTLYFDINPNHNNITVQFETKNSDGTYTEFDWRKEFCSSYDGRFPVLTENKVPLDGTLRYAIISTGLVSLFGGKTLRLKVQIKDRTLHLSNIVTKEIKIN